MKPDDKIRIERINMLLARMSKPCSINDVIDSIYYDDVMSGRNRNSWRFYVHLNKLPAQMERLNLITWTGKYKMGTYREEKVWKRLESKYE
jgi:hypothetical protein